MRGRWVLPFAFGGLMLAGLIVADAIAEETVTARAEVFVPLADGPAEDSRPTAADEAAIFESDRITTAIETSYGGDLDPSRDASASVEPDTNSVVVIEVAGTRSDAVVELSDVAARVFVETRQAERLDALRTQIDLLEAESAAIAQEMEEMIIIDFTTRAADGIPADTATPISEAVAALAARDAALASEITRYDQDLAALSLDGYEIGSTSELDRSGPLVGTMTKVGLILLAMAIGAAVAVGLGRRRDAAAGDVSPFVPSPEFESNPMAWIDALVGEPDGVFIEFDKLVYTAGFEDLAEVDSDDLVPAGSDDPVPAESNDLVIDLRTGSLADEEDELRMAINPFFSMAADDDDDPVPASRSSGVTRATFEAAAHGVGRVKAALVRPRAG